MFSFKANLLTKIIEKKTQHMNDNMLLQQRLLVTGRTDFRENNNLVYSSINDSELK